MQICKGIKEFVDDYDVFFIDIWGVVHDGTDIYPGVIPTLRFLRRCNKKVLFVSNSALSGEIVSSRFKRVFGINNALYERIVTAGDIGYFFLKDNSDNSYKSIGRNYTIIGADSKYGFLKDLGYNKSTSLDEIDFILVTGYIKEYNDLFNIDDELGFLKEAIKSNITMICVNPDSFIIKKDGGKLYCSGAIAWEYKKMGGEVIYCGKPYREIYEYSMRFAEQSDRSKVVALGDNVFTDIKGASDFGIDSYLVLSGISSSTNTTREDLEKQWKFYNAYPKGMLAKFDI